MQTDSADRSALSRYFADIRRNQPLERDEELAIARQREAGVEDARDRLVEANLGFVIRIAKDYRNLGIPFEDLVNEGNIGLIQAAQRFDSSRGTKFITYAMWWIRKSILAAVAEQSTLVRIPCNQRKKMRTIRQAQDSLRREAGRAPSMGEVSERLAQPAQKIERALQFERREISIDDRPKRDGERPLADRLADTEQACPERAMIRSQLGDLAYDAMDSLGPREREVLCCRLGLDGSPPMKLKEVGTRLSISRERVRQIEQQAFARLRKILQRRKRGQI